MTDVGYTNLINTEGVKDDNVKNISGLSGDLTYYPEAKTLVFLFEVNNRMYSIDIMDISSDEVAECEMVFGIILSAWLKSSGYKQTAEDLEKEENITQYTQNSKSSSSSDEDDLGADTPLGTYEEAKKDAEALGQEHPYTREQHAQNVKDYKKNWD